MQDLSTQYPQFRLGLPQVVVVGPQSSGKSSVLEQIVQRDILPRGSDLVTRCPIIIHLCPADNEEFVEFDDKCRIVKLENVRGEIEARMQKICGRNKGIVRTPITMFVHLRNALHLTLVDLPGITKVPKGDQPRDIENKVADLILEYARMQNSFIIAVLSANVDIANSDALKIAAIADKDGSRTLGVVTKIDLMDAGTNCVDVLENLAHPLKHGYIGLVNRTQVQINANTSLADVQRHEELFFAQSSVYSQVADRCGAKHLTSTLCDIFFLLVCAEMPHLETSLGARLRAARQELKQMEDVGKIRDADRNEIAMSYQRTVVGLVEECHPKNSHFSLTKQANLVYELKKIFKADFGDLRVEELVKEELRYSTSLFVSEKVLGLAFDKKANYLKQTIDLAVDSFHGRVVEGIDCVRSAHHPKLARWLNSEARGMFHGQYTKLRATLNGYFDVQLSFLNFDHPDFCTSEVVVNALQSSIRTKKSKRGELWSFLSKESTVKVQLDGLFELKILLNLIDDYYAIFKKSFIDFAVKACHCFYLRYLRDGFYTDINRRAVCMDLHELCDEPCIALTGKLETEVRAIEAALSDLGSTLAQHHD